MVNVEKVHKQLQNLELALNHLREISSMPEAEFLINGMALGAAKYYLQTAIEACIDIGNHIISAEGFRSPKDYREVFDILNEEEVISDEVTEKFRKMAGLRNRLVHLYWEVDDELIYEYLKSGLGDFSNYAQMILKFLNKTE